MVQSKADANLAHRDAKVVREARKLARALPPPPAIKMPRKIVKQAKLPSG